MMNIRTGNTTCTILALLNTYTLKKYLAVCFLALLLSSCFSANAQQTRHSDRAMSLNTSKLNEKFTFFFDTQFRSTDKWARRKPLFSDLQLDTF
jgi:hypothetical protein